MDLAVKAGVTKQEASGSVYIATQKEFFVRLWGIPRLRQTAERRYEVRFSNAFGAFVVVLVIEACAVPMFYLFVKLSHSYLPLAIPLLMGFFFYLIHCKQKEQDANIHVVLENTILYLDKPGWKQSGRLVGVFCAMLDGVEDPENSENGSMRIYVKTVEEDGKVVTIPLLFAQASIKKLGKMLAEKAGCPFHYSRGLKGIPS